MFLIPSNLTESTCIKLGNEKLIDNVSYNDIIKNVYSGHILKSIFDHLAQPLVVPLAKTNKKTDFYQRSYRNTRATRNFSGQGRSRGIRVLL